LTAALVIFALTYLSISVGWLRFLHLDRPAAALCGAVAMVAAGVLSVDQALAAIDLHVLVLLFGVMVIAAYLIEARFFRYTAWWVLTRTRSARSLLWSLVFVAGGLSALLVNDTVCLVLTPLVMAIVVEAELPPLPYLSALAGAANVGGVVSFSGNPQNMMIGRAAAGDPSYAEYMIHALPAGLVALTVLAATLTFLFRRELPAGPLPERHAPRPGLNGPLAAKGVASLLAFVVMALAGVPLAAASATAAAALILAARLPARAALAKPDWALLVFFASLFVVVAGLRESGAVAEAYAAIAPHLGTGTGGELGFAGAAVIGSNLVSNVPYVMVAVDWVPAMPDPYWGWILLAFASTLAGNLTMFGSIANIIVFESAGPRGEVGFFAFLRIGATVTIATLASALGVLYLQRTLGL
jgi:Na+/H+ antiporter NhaD/arsenite permease-like protein